MTEQTTTPPRLGGFIIATGNGRWAWGKDITDAKKAVKGHGGKLDRFMVYQMPAGSVDAWVDQMGAIHWEWAEGFEHSGTTTLVEERLPA